jgi:cold shock protein
MVAAWEAIRNLISEKTRDLRQRRRRAVDGEAHDHPRSDPDVPVRSAQPEIAQPEITQPEITQPEIAQPEITQPEIERSPDLPVFGKVKWFNPSKGYGFIELSDGSGDAFLHATALSGSGITTLQSGETLELRVAPGQRGPQVTEVISVDSSTAAPPLPRKSSRSPLDRQALEVSVQETGTVKWYSAAKGFGFIVRDSGGKDVFVHASTLERAGITGLSEGQRVFMGVAEGRKGPEAASIQVAR